ncbi:hypothetical protein [Jiella avicenniae]|uniref:hypothetical protein n=1 Tax=Jiella avicenniae TaxID=2907202 RepID=UPI001F28C07B|nr:hypothetical protein [Jiella avicenniae]
MFDIDTSIFDRRVAYNRDGYKLVHRAFRIEKMLDQRDLSQYFERSGFFDGPNFIPPDTSTKTSGRRTRKMCSDELFQKVQIAIRGRISPSQVTGPRRLEHELRQRRIERINDEFLGRPRA